MPSVTFEGGTHREIVDQVRIWLASVDAEAETSIAMSDVVIQSADLTHDALKVIAQAAPGPVAESEIFKALNNMGHIGTEATRDAALAGINSVESATGGSVVRNVAERGSRAVWQMSAPIARQILKAAVNEVK